LIYSIDSSVVAVCECVPSARISEEEGHDAAYSRRGDDDDYRRTIDEIRTTKE